MAKHFIYIFTDLSSKFQASGAFKTPHQKDRSLLWLNSILNNLAVGFNYGCKFYFNF
jgi:hypothetical protein